MSRASKCIGAINRTRDPTCIFGHLGHLFIPHLSHVAKHREDDKARDEARHAVYHTGHQGVSGMTTPAACASSAATGLRAQPTPTSPSALSADTMATTYSVGKAGQRCLKTRP